MGTDLSFHFALEENSQQRELRLQRRCPARFLTPLPTPLSSEMDNTFSFSFFPLLALNCLSTLTMWTSHQPWGPLVAQGDSRMSERPPSLCPACFPRQLLLILWL